jgi:hypothetical protein
LPILSSFPPHPPFGPISIFFVFPFPICFFLLRDLWDQGQCSRHSGYAVGLMALGPNPARGKKFFCPPKRPDMLWVHTSHLINIRNY